MEFRLVRLEKARSAEHDVDLARPKIADGGSIAGHDNIVRGRIWTKGTIRIAADTRLLIPHGIQVREVGYPEQGAPGDDVDRIIRLLLHRQPVLIGRVTCA